MSACRLQRRAGLKLWVWVRATQQPSEPQPGRDPREQCGRRSPGEGKAPACPGEHPAPPQAARRGQRTDSWVLLPWGYHRAWTKAVLRGRIRQSEERREVSENRQVLLLTKNSWIKHLKSFSPHVCLFLKPPILEWR